MESLIDVNRSHKSDNHGISQKPINYPHSSQLQAYDAYATAKKYEKQFRRCKSCTDIEKQAKINNKMGSRVSRSHSCDNVMVNSVSFVYEPLNRKNLLVNQDIVSDNDDSDDYKLLDSSSDDESDNNEFSNVKLNISNNDDCHECPIKDSNDINDDSIDDDNGSYERTTNTNKNMLSINCDGQQHDNTDENSCTIITKSTNGHTLQLNVNGTVPSSNINDNCSLITKFSTLPRMKAHESNNNENCVRRSCKVTKKRTDVLNEREIEEVKKPVKLENVNNNCECSGNSSSSRTMLNIQENNTHHDNVINEIQKSDKTNDLLFHCTTLPKARSRMSEPPHFRHSLRHSIDPERPRKCLSEFNASGIETTAVNCDESTSGAGKS